MGFPLEYAPPLAHASVIATFVPTAPDVRLDHRVNCIGLADLVVCQRPPRPHFFGEHAPGSLLAYLNIDSLFDTVRIDRAVFRHHLSDLLCSCSAACLNAASVSSQNPSSQLRNAS